MKKNLILGLILSCGAIGISGNAVAAETKPVAKTGIKSDAKIDNKGDAKGIIVQGGMKAAPKGTEPERAISDKGDKKSIIGPGGTKEAPKGAEPERGVPTDAKAKPVLVAPAAKK